MVHFCESAGWGHGGGWGAQTSGRTVFQVRLCERVCGWSEHLNQYLSKADCPPQSGSNQSKTEENKTLSKREFRLPDYLSWDLDLGSSDQNLHLGALLVSDLQTQTAPTPILSWVSSLSTTDPGIRKPSQSCESFLIMNLFIPTYTGIRTYIHAYPIGLVSLESPANTALNSYIRKEETFNKVQNELCKERQSCSKCVEERGECRQPGSGVLGLTPRLPLGLRTFHWLVSSLQRTAVGEKTVSV